MSPSHKVKFLSASKNQEKKFENQETIRETKSPIWHEISKFSHLLVGGKFWGSVEVQLFSVNTDPLNLNIHLGEIEKYRLYIKHHNYHPTYMHSYKA